MKDSTSRENKKANFFMIKNLIREKNREAVISPLDNLIKTHNSEYQYLFSVIKKMSESNQDSMEEWYPIPNMMRKFLETFFAFKIPSKKIFTYQLKEALRIKFPDQNIKKKERIESLLNEKSHGGIESFYLDNFLECKEVLQDIISLIKKLDKDHYEELCKCID